VVQIVLITARVAAADVMIGVGCMLVIRGLQQLGVLAAMIADSTLMWKVIWLLAAGASCRYFPSFHHAANTARKAP
jgi:hypothetical protein